MNVKIERRQYSVMEEIEVLTKAIAELEKYEGSFVSKLSEKSKEHIRQVITPLMNDNSDRYFSPSLVFGVTTHDKSPKIDLAAWRERLAASQRMANNLVKYRENQVLVDQLREAIEQVAELSGRAKDTFGPNWAQEMTNLDVLDRAPTGWTFSRNWHAKRS